MDQEALPDVDVPPQMHPAQAAGLVEMGVGSLEAFPALAHQPQPAGSPDPPPIGVHGGAGGALASSASPGARLRHVAAQPQVRRTTSVSLLW